MSLLRATVQAIVPTNQEGRLGEWQERWLG